MTGSRLTGVAGAGECRELPGGTWDEAHHFIGRWEACPHEQRVRWLQLAGWVKAVNAQAAMREAGHAQEGEGDRHSG